MKINLRFKLDLKRFLVDKFKATNLSLQCKKHDCKINEVKKVRKRNKHKMKKPKYKKKVLLLEAKVSYIHNSKQ